METGKQPLLTIELQDESSVPKVKYKGKEITMKQSIDFQWTTDTHEPGKLEYAIQHREDMDQRTIEHKGK